MNSARTATRKTSWRQILTFLLVGGASSVVDFGVFMLLNRVFHLAAWASTAISFACAFAINYRGNRDLVFRAGKVRGALPRYLILVGGNWVLTTLIVAGLVKLGAWPWLAKVISMAVAAAVNFVVLRYYVFRENPGIHRRRR